jgi:hypothetical protein
MKKLLLFSLITVLVLSCKKTEYSPEGPTDVRVKNSSDQAFTEVVVNTSGGTNSLGSIPANGSSEYIRFDKAYPKAEISAVVNGQVFSTGPVNYNGMTYIGQARITYVVLIKSTTNKTLEISEVLLDAPLD